MSAPIPLASTNERTEIERFIAKTVDTEHGLIWAGGINKDGYGYFRLAGGRAVYAVTAHRYWWRYNNGPIPKGFDVHHTCHMRRCLTHLELLDSATNRRKHMARKLRLESERKVYAGIFLNHYNKHSKMSA